MYEFSCFMTCCLWLKRCGEQGRLWLICIEKEFEREMSGGYTIKVKTFNKQQFEVFVGESSNIQTVHSLQQKIAASRNNTTWEALTHCGLGLLLLLCICICIYI